MIKRITVSALLMALSVVALLIGSVWTLKIAMLFLSSLICSVVIMECGPKYGWVHFIGVSILSFLLVPKKALVYAYMLFLGYYPIVKLYLEKPVNRFLEWLFKMLFFNIILATVYIIFKLFLMPSFNPAIIAFVLKHLSAIILSLEVIFIFYDIFLSYVITYYQKKIRGLIKYD